VKGERKNTLQVSPARDDLIHMHTGSISEMTREEWKGQSNKGEDGKVNQREEVDGIVLERVIQSLNEV